MNHLPNPKLFPYFPVNLFDKVRNTEQKFNELLADLKHKRFSKRSSKGWDSRKNKINLQVK